VRNFRRQRRQAGRSTGPERLSSGSEARIGRSQAPLSCVARTDRRLSRSRPPPAAPTHQQRPGALRKTEAPRAPSQTAPSSLHSHGSAGGSGGAVHGGSVPFALSCGRVLSADNRWGSLAGKSFCSSGTGSTGPGAGEHSPVSCTDGAGRSAEKPFSPKTRNSRPSKIRAINVAIFIGLLSSTSE
jgi:hypothetical protein